MVGSGMCPGRHEALIQVRPLQTEQVQRLLESLGVYGLASGRRRLQGHGGEFTVAATFDRNFARVDRHGENAVAKTRYQRRSERDGGIPAERHLGHRREVADAPATALPGREHRLGKANLAGDLLHLCCGGQLIGNDNTGRVAAERSIGKRCESHDIHRVSLVSFVSKQSARCAASCAIGVLAAAPPSSSTMQEGSMAWTTVTPHRSISRVSPW